MKTRAAVAFEAKKPLEIVELDLEGPKSGEVLVEIMATGICHTDAYTLDGFDSEGIFPSILGHEGAGVVREVGPGVTSVKPGDHVIPLYTPECRQCKSCLSGKTNLCTAIRATQGKGLMPENRWENAFAVQPVERVGVSMADTGRHDLDQHFPGLGAVKVEFDDLEWLLGFEGDGGAGLHESFPQHNLARLATLRAFGQCSKAKREDDAQLARSTPCAHHGGGNRDWGVRSDAP